jgi:Ni,Fe-hydrogenase III component G
MDSSSQKQLPLILRNMKKTFGQNIQGPITNREREYQATTKPVFIYDLINFMSVRGVNKLAAIHAWVSDDKLKLAYHFVFNIGTQMLDSKLTVVVISAKDEKSLKSIKKLFPNAGVFEEEITKSYGVQFL